MSYIHSFVFQSATLRVISHDGAEWFVLADIRRALGINASANVVAIIKDDNWRIAEIDTSCGRRSVPVVNAIGLCIVAGFGQWAVVRPFVTWVFSEVVESIRCPRAATLLPKRSRDGLYSTTELADRLGIYPNTLGKFTRHLKTKRHGERRPAIGLHSESVIDQWFWNEAGRAVVLKEFGKLSGRPARAV